MFMKLKEENGPPVKEALLLIHPDGRAEACAGRRIGKRDGNGKPVETPGRKAIGTKVLRRYYVSLAADYKRQTGGNVGTQNKGAKA